MKKILLTLGFIAFITISLNLVNAEYCFDESYGDAYAKVCMDYPKCDGILNNAINCVGRWYLPISFVGDKFFIAFQQTNWAKFNEYSNTDSFMQEIINDRYYINPVNEKLQYYYICAWDKGDEDKYGNYDWSYICGGWNLNKYFPYNFYINECKNGEEKCVLNSISICSNGKWQTPRIVKDKCNVQCVDDSDCPEDKEISSSCIEGKTNTNYLDNYCESYSCKSKQKTILSDLQVGNCGIECITNTDCGNNYFTGKNICDIKNLDVVREYHNLTCENNKCLENIENKLYYDCEFGCYKGQCKAPECNSNIECISLCGDKQPTCENNYCYCAGDEIYLPNKIKNYVIPIIVVSIFGLVAFIVWQRRKKPRRKKS